MNENLDQLWDLNFKDFIVGQIANGYESPCDGEVGAFPPQDCDPIKRLDDLLRQILGEPIDLEQRAKIENAIREELRKQIADGPKPPLAIMDQPIVPRPQPTPIPGFNPPINIAGDPPYSIGGEIGGDYADPAGWGFSPTINPFRSADELTRALKNYLRNPTTQVREANGGECSSNPGSTDPTPTLPTDPTPTPINPGRPVGGGGGTPAPGGGGASSKPVVRSPISPGPQPIRQ